MSPITILSTALIYLGLALSGFHVVAAATLYWHRVGTWNGTIMLIGLMLVAAGIAAKVAIKTEGRA
jgi:hypothetical protein